MNAGHRNSLKKSNSNDPPVKITDSVFYHITQHYTLRLHQLKDPLVLLWEEEEGEENQTNPEIRVTDPHMQYIITFDGSSQ